MDSSYYDSGFSYNNKDIVGRTDHGIELNSCPGSLTISDDKNDFRSSFTENNSMEKSEDHCSDSGFMKDSDRNFNLENPFMSPADQLNTVDFKFSIDMPLHKFISSVNLAAKALCNCRRRVRWVLSKRITDLLAGNKTNQLDGKHG